MVENRVLVTGATGFIGRQVVASLLEANQSLNILVRAEANCPSHWRQHQAITVVVAGDLASADLTRQDVQTAFASSRIVVHLAGLAHVAQADRDNAEEKFALANEVATKRLVEAALHHRVRSFIHLSSLGAVTANSSTAPVDDNLTPSPATAYGRSKRAAELHLRPLLEAGAFAISLRPPLVVGANARGNWGALQAIASTGLPLPLASLTEKRSYISVQTLAEAIVMLCCSDHPPQFSGDYCIADNELLSTAEIVSELRMGMGTSPRLFPCPPLLLKILGIILGRRRQIEGLTGSLHVDPSRFYSQFKFSPALPIREAIRRSGAAYAARADVSHDPASI
jgi:UDP-glucose 4-epimerase